MCCWLLGEGNIRIYPTFASDCNELKDYLLSMKVNTVAMESTGVYWAILYSVLEDADIDVFLVNGRDVKNLPDCKKRCERLLMVKAIA